jgi:NADH-quinone oxidoreductase subunit J
MTLESIFFILFAIVAIIAALGVITFKNPVHSVFALIVCLLQIAAIYILLRSPFLAVVQIFIYVGAVMVLFIFVVMVLDIKKASLEAFPGVNRWPVYVILPVVAVEFLIVIFGRSFAHMQLEVAGAETKVEVIGRALFTEYLLPFEVISVLLLAAMVGAIILAKKRWD